MPGIGKDFGKKVKGKNIFSGKIEKNVPRDTSDTEEYNVCHVLDYEHRSRGEITSRYRTGEFVSYAQPLPRHTEHLGDLWAFVNRITRGMTSPLGVMDETVVSCQMRMTISHRISESESTLRPYSQYDSDDDTVPAAEVGIEQGATKEIWTSDILVDSDDDQELMAELETQSFSSQEPMDVNCKSPPKTKRAASKQLKKNKKSKYKRIPFRFPLKDGVLV